MLALNLLVSTLPISLSNPEVNGVLLSSMIRYVHCLKCMGLNSLNLSISGYDGIVFYWIAYNMNGSKFSGRRVSNNNTISMRMY